MVPGFVEDASDPGLSAIVDLVERIGAACDISVVALHHPPRRRRYQLAGATVHSLGLTRSGIRGRAETLGRGLLRLRGLNAQRPFDLFHGLWADEPGALATLAARAVGRPSVVSVMGGELMALPEIGYGSQLGRGGRWSVAISLRLADLVTAGSHQLWREASRRVDSGRVMHLPLGVDLELFSPTRRRRTSGRPLTVLQVAALEPVKDQVTLLRACARVMDKHQGVRLQVAGETRLLAQMTRLAQRLGIAERVEFLGWLSRADLADRYRAADLVVVSSRHEAQSMAAIEAAACAIPVVGTAVGALPELADGAITVPVGDVAALADAISIVLGDGNLRRRMGRAGREAAEASYDLAKTAAALLEAYEALTAGRERKAALNRSR